MAEFVAHRMSGTGDGDFSEKQGDKGLGQGGLGGSYTICDNFSLYRVSERAHIPPSSPLWPAAGLPPLRYRLPPSSGELLS